MMHENTSRLIEAVADLWGFALGYAELQDTPAHIVEYKLKHGDSLIVNERLAGGGLLKFTQWHQLGPIHTLYVHEGERIITPYGYIKFDAVRDVWTYHQGLNMRQFDTLKEASEAAEWTC